MDTFPDVIRVEPVGICNFRCRHCLTGQKPNMRATLAFADFAAILRQFVDAGRIPRVMVFYNGGEPLINKELELFIAAAKKNGVQKAMLVTNCSLLTAERAEGLIEAGLDEMHVSFDGRSAEENDWIRRNANFSRDAGNLKRFLQFRNKQGLTRPNVKISNVIIYNRDEADKYLERGMGPFSEWPDYLREFFSEFVEELDFQSVVAMVWPGYEVAPPFTVKSLPPLNPRYCSVMFETVTILSNGDVDPCCYDIGGRMVLGNVFRESVFDIWAKEEYVTFRKNFRKGIYNDLCLSCNKVSPRILCKS